jgi:hypothetical protein
MRCSRCPIRSCCKGRADREDGALGRDGVAILGVAGRGGAAICGIGRGAMAGRCGGGAGRNAGAAGRAMAGGGAGRAMAGGRTIAGAGAGRAIGGAAGRAIGACGAAPLGSWACAPTLAAITIAEAPSRKAAKRPSSGSMVAAPCSSSIALAINARSQETFVASLVRHCDFATQATRAACRGTRGRRRAKAAERAGDRGQAKSHSEKLLILAVEADSGRPDLVAAKQCVAGN